MRIRRFTKLGRSGRVGLGKPHIYLAFGGRCWICTTRDGCLGEGPAPEFAYEAWARMRREFYPTLWQQVKDLILR